MADKTPVLKRYRYQFSWFHEGEVVALNEAQAHNLVCQAMSYGFDGFLGVSSDDGEYGANHTEVTLLETNVPDEDAILEALVAQSEEQGFDEDDEDVIGDLDL